MDQRDKDFIVYARQNTYASGQEAEVIDGFDTYVVTNDEGDLEYSDRYKGTDRFFHGTEVLKKNGVIIWMMSYHGELKEGYDPDIIFPVLQKFILKHAKATRFDMEIEDHDDVYGYFCEGGGESNFFCGTEQVLVFDDTAHTMDYFGTEFE